MSRFERNLNTYSISRRNNKSPSSVITKLFPSNIVFANLVSRSLCTVYLSLSLLCILLTFSVFLFDESFASSRNVDVEVILCESDRFHYLPSDELWLDGEEYQLTKAVLPDGFQELRDFYVENMEAYKKFKVGCDEGSLIKNMVCDSAKNGTNSFDTLASSHIMRALDRLRLDNLFKYDTSLDHESNIESATGDAIYDEMPIRVLRMLQDADENYLLSLKLLVSGTHEKFRENSDLPNLNYSETLESNFKDMMTAHDFEHYCRLLYDSTKVSPLDDVYFYTPGEYPFFENHGNNVMENYSSILREYDTSSLPMVDLVDVLKYSQDYERSPNQVYSFVTSMDDMSELLKEYDTKMLPFYEKMRDEESPDLDMYQYFFSDVTLAQVFFLNKLLDLTTPDDYEETLKDHYTTVQEYKKQLQSQSSPFIVFLNYLFHLCETLWDIIKYIYYKFVVMFINPLFFPSEEEVTYDLTEITGDYSPQVLPLDLDKQLIPGTANALVLKYRWPFLTELVKDNFEGLVKISNPNLPDSYLSLGSRAMSYYETENTHNDSYQYDSYELRSYLLNSNTEIINASILEAAKTARERSLQNDSVLLRDTDRLEKFVDVVFYCCDSGLDNYSTMMDKYTITEDGLVSYYNFVNLIDKMIDTDLEVFDRLINVNDDVFDERLCSSNLHYDYINHLRSSHNAGLDDARNAYYAAHGDSSIRTTINIKSNMYNFPFYLQIVVLFLSFGVFFFYVGAWINEINHESDILGRYTSKVRTALVYAFFLFVVSEFMVFFGFFWGMYELFSLGQELTGNIQYNFSQTDFLLLCGDPLLGSIALFVSGYLANYAMLCVSVFNRKEAVFFLSVSVALGLFFLNLQSVEYTSLVETCSRKTSLSIFYITTGLHGFHVFVGVTFLGYVTFNVFKANVIVQKLLSFYLCLIYWHFVDYVWLFVVYKLYWLFSYPILLL